MTGSKLSTRWQLVGWQLPAPQLGLRRCTRGMSGDWTTLEPRGTTRVVCMCMCRNGGAGTDCVESNERTEGSVSSGGAGVGAPGVGGGRLSPLAPRVPSPIIPPLTFHCTSSGIPNRTWYNTTREACGGRSMVWRTHSPMWHPPLLDVKCHTRPHLASRPSKGLTPTPKQTPTPSPTSLRAAPSSDGAAGHGAAERRWT